MIRAERAYVRDLVYVLRHPSEQTRLDLRDFTPAEALDRALGWLAGAVTFHIDGRPAAVFGFVDESAPVKITWFVATQAYFAGGGPVMRFTRRFLATWAAGRAIKTASWNRHPSAARWFKMLGYVVEAEKNGQVIYAYDHRSR